MYQPGFSGSIPPYFAVVYTVVPDCEFETCETFFSDSGDICDICDVVVNCDICDKAVINVCELFCWVSLYFKYEMCIV